MSNEENEQHGPTPQEFEAELTKLQRAHAINQAREYLKREHQYEDDELKTLCKSDESLLQMAREARELTTLGNEEDDDWEASKSELSESQQRDADMLRRQVTRDAEERRESALKQAEHEDKAKFEKLQEDLKPEARVSLRELMDTRRELAALTEEDGFADEE